MSDEAKDVKAVLFLLAVLMRWTADNGDDNITMIDVPRVAVFWAAVLCARSPANSNTNHVPTHRATWGICSRGIGRSHAIVHCAS